MSGLTSQRLRELFMYSPLNGSFIRIKAGGKSLRQQIGYMPRMLDALGYPVLTIDGKRYFCHRLAWLYVTGNWPKYEIDHIDGDRSNYVFTNLRDVKHSVNQQNSYRPRANNKSGLPGVSWCKVTNKWSANIRVNNKKNYLGSFTDKTAAHKVYVQAKRKYHPGFVQSSTL